MPDWDADGPELQANLVHVLGVIARAAQVRDKPLVEATKQWHREMMRGLTLKDTRFVGASRGEQGLEKIQVRIGANFGVGAHQVAGELALFEAKLQGLVAELDAVIPLGHEPDADEVAAVIDLCAWIHSEWVRIHPFVNGNGRMARLWVNGTVRRYGLPPFLRLRPRPDSGYGEAGIQAMRGDWKPTSVVFRQLFNDFANE